MDSDNYPECCHAIYILNAGATFTAIWRMLSPFVDKGTRDKVHVIANARQAEVRLLPSRAVFALSPARHVFFSSRQYGGSADCRHIILHDLAHLGLLWVWLVDDVNKKHFVGRALTL
jgi:hypothetical protein